MSEQRLRPNEFHVNACLGATGGAMAGSLLEALTFPRFLQEEDSNGAFGQGAADGGKIPRYNGDPTRFSEWQFRVKTRQRREKSLTDEKKKEMGPLGLRLIEGLSGHALQVAQLLAIEELEKEHGAEYLMEHLALDLRPRRQQQARELYEAGAQSGGVLSRQPAETMPQFILRRKAWYRAMLDLNSELKLPEMVLAEQLLMNSGISDDHKLLIRTAVGEDKITFDKVAAELINQHAKAGMGSRRPFDSGKGTYAPRPASWTPLGSKGGKKGFYHKPYPRTAFHVDVDYEYGTDELYDDDYSIHEPAAHLGVYPQQMDDGADYHDYPEQGNYAEEHLAFLSEQGLDLADDDACDYAANIIQAEEEAYLARQSGAQKGHRALKPPPFEISGSFSLDQKKAKLMALKARTTCRKCGATGHWSGDAVCPFSKGKGKGSAARAGTTSSTSTSHHGRFGKGAAHSKGNPSTGSGGTGTKPRTVYFSINETANPNGPATAFLAFRVPDQGARHAQGGYHAVPPPASLRAGQASDGLTLQLSTQEMARASSDATWVNKPLDEDQDMVMLIEALGAAEQPSPTAEAANPSADAAPEAAPADTSTTSTTSTPPLAAPRAAVTRVCPHRNLTAHGSNQYFAIKKCKDCGVVVEKIKRVGGTTPKAKATPGCAHHRVHWRGSNGFVRIKTCMDCGFQERFEAAVTYKKTAREQEAESSSTFSADEALHAIDTFSKAMRTRLELLPPGERIPGARLQEALKLTLRQAEIWQKPADGYEGPMDLGRSRTAAEKEEQAQRMRIRGETVVTFGKYLDQTYLQAFQDEDYRLWFVSNMAGANQPRTHKNLRQFFIDYNLYLGRSLLTREETDRLVFMVEAEQENHSNDQNHTNPDHPGGPSAPEVFAEQDLVAILDTGCNLTCHGDAWLERYLQATDQKTPELEDDNGTNIRGIGGRVETNGQRRLPLSLELLGGGVAQGELTSTELKNSTAPLLLSLQAQKALGLVIDLTAEVVHSQTLGKTLKLVIHNGLFGLRLLPPEVADDEGRPHMEDYDYPTDKGTKDRDPNHHQSEVDKGEAKQENHSNHQNHITNPDRHRGSPSSGLEAPVYLALDTLSGRTMNRSQHQKVENGIKEVTARDHHLWNQLATKGTRRHGQHLLPRGCRTFLMELVTGAALLTHMAAIDYELSVSEPVYLKHNHHDLTTEAGRAELERQIARDDRYAISCTYHEPLWSIWGQVLQGAPWEEVIRVRQKWTPVIKWIFRVGRERIEKGRQFFFEHPWNSDLWKLAQVMKETNNPAVDGGTLEHLEVLKGESDNMNNLETAYATATLQVKNKLWQCHDKGEYPEGPPQDRSPIVCQAVLEGLLESLDDLHTRTAFPAEAEHEDDYGDAEETPLLDGILGPEDFVTSADPLVVYKERKDHEENDVMAEEGPGRGQAGEEAQPLQAKRAAWKELGYGQRVALRRLHNMTGHASPASMQRLLRTAGADPKVIRALDHFTCPSCDSVVKPRKPAPTKMPSEYSFNQEISLDIFIIKDTRGVRHKIMSMVDLGTLFHVSAHVGTGAGPPSSALCARVLQERWFAWAGSPKTVTMDRGCENRGRLQAMLKAFGVEIRYIGLESPFQLGRGERQGSILKDIMRHTIAERQLHGVESIEMLVIEATSVKNNRIHHGGFTPSQWVLGRLPLESDALTNLGADGHLGLHQEIEDGSSTFAKQLQIRNAARQAFAQTDSASRIRSAMLRKATPVRGPYVVGDLVCFHRKDRKNSQGKWYGPARVIGHEGKSTMWIIHGGVPLTVSNENCRYATGNEALAKRVLELRPSRKRKREDEAENEDGDPYGYPFGDDLSGGLGAQSQRTYFDISGEGTPEVAPVPAANPSPATTTTEAASPSPHEHPPVPPPPGIMLDTVHEIPVPGEDDDDGLGGSSPSSAMEPEQELVPPSRRASEVVVSSTTEPSPAARTSPTPTPLQRALHRSVDAVDGVTWARRGRSRSPPPTSRNLAGESVEENGPRVFNAFLARRVCKKSQAARSKELNYSKATGEQKEGMEAARRAEWRNWLGFDAVKVLGPDEAAKFMSENPQSEIVPTRWVETDKAQPWEQPRYKARIVVRGDLEREGGTRTDSPTCSGTMLNVLLSYAASKRLRLHGGDITASFLQGEQMSRVLVLRPPKGGLPDVEEGSLLIANKPVYGTRDAPRGFWRRLHTVCVAQGLRPIPHEHAAYVLNKKDGNISGILVSHVDDLLWCGDKGMDEVMAAIQAEFKFGSLEHGDKFEYCGRTIQQGDEVDGIKITCPNTAAKVRGVHLDGKRRYEKDKDATAAEISQLRSVVGSLNWVTRVCRPDIAYAVHKLQTSMSQATVNDLVMCNSVLSYVKKTPNEGILYKYEALDYDDMEILSVADASHAADYDVNKNGKLMGHRSQSGRMLLLASSSFMKQMIWRKKGEEVGDPLYDDRPPDDGTTKVCWIETKTMVADGLTKSMKCQQLKEMMMTGKLIVDMDKTKSKKAAKTWLEQLFPRERRTVAYNVTISACEKGQQWSLALRLGKEMSETAVPKDQFTYGACISACARAGLWQRAVALLEEMGRVPLKKDTVCCSAAISAC
ncbi:RE2, partial [Symbiodinium sp. KB8]